MSDDLSAFPYALPYLSLNMNSLSISDQQDPDSWLLQRSLPPLHQSLREMKIGISDSNSLTQPTHLTATRSEVSCDVPQQSTTGRVNVYNYPSQLPPPHHGTPKPRHPKTNFKAPQDHHFQHYTMSHLQNYPAQTFLHAHQPQLPQQPQSDNQRTVKLKKFKQTEYYLQSSNKDSADWISETGTNGGTKQNHTYRWTNTIPTEFQNK